MGFISQFLKMLFDAAGEGNLVLYLSILLQ